MNRTRFQIGLSLIMIMVSTLSTVPVRGQTILWSRELRPEVGLAWDVFAGVDGVYVLNYTSLLKIHFDGSDDWAVPLGASAASGGVSGDASFVYVTHESLVKKFSLEGVEQWSRSLGDPAFVQGLGISAHHTGVYVAGYVAGDAFVRKYSLDGGQEWTVPVGGPSTGEAFGQAFGVSVDDSGVYVAGFTFSPGSSFSDAFLKKYNFDGLEQWMNSDAFGGTGSNVAYGVSVHDSEVYVAGFTIEAPLNPALTSWDVIIKKYDSNGMEQWKDTFGPGKTNIARAISVSGCGVNVVGFSSGETILNPFFARQYDFSGSVRWTQFGPLYDDQALGVSSDASAAYVIGNARDPDTGIIRTFVEKFSCAQEVGVDIKPGSFPNSINTKSRGTIPLAILSTSTFDSPSIVDRNSLTFGRTGDETSPAFCTRSVEDVNGDGLLDLVCHFTTQLTGFMPGDTEGVLRGQLLDGTLFEGKDSVRIIF